MKPVKMWAVVYNGRIVAVYWRRPACGDSYVRVEVREVRKKKRRKSREAGRG